MYSISLCICKSYPSHRFIALSLHHWRLCSTEFTPFRRFQNHVIDFHISSKTMSLISTFLPKPCHWFHQLMQLFSAYQHPNFLGRVQLYMMISIFSIFFPLCVLVFSSGLLNTNMRKSSCMPFHYIQLPNNTEPFFCPVLPSHMLPALPWLPNPQKQTSIFKLDFFGECFYVV